MKKTLLSIVFALAAYCTLGGVAHAGTLQITANDQNGAALAGVQVTINQIDKLGRQVNTFNGVTDGMGRAQFNIQQLTNTDRFFIVAIYLDQTQNATVSGGRLTNGGVYNQDFTFQVMQPLIGLGVGEVPDGGMEP